MRRLVTVGRLGPADLAPGNHGRADPGPTAHAGIKIPLHADAVTNRQFDLVPKCHVEAGRLLALRVGHP